MTSVARIEAAECVPGHKVGERGGLYRVKVLFHDGGRACFCQHFASPPRSGDLWTMTEPRLECPYDPAAITMYPPA